jgi:hypothetical protein
MPDVISRHDAANQGRHKFFTGKPCKHGHTAERYVVNGTCTECASWKILKAQQSLTRSVRHSNVAMPPSGYAFPAGTELTPERVAYVHTMVLRYIAFWSDEYDRKLAEVRARGLPDHAVRPDPVQRAAE